MFLQWSVLFDTIWDTVLQYAVTDSLWYISSINLYIACNLDLKGPFVWKKRNLK